MQPEQQRMRNMKGISGGQCGDGGYIYLSLIRHQHKLHLNKWETPSACPLNKALTFGKNYISSLYLSLSLADKSSEE